MAKLLSTLPVMFYCFYLTPVLAIEAYTPKQIDPVRETWRWQEMKKLDTHGLRSLIATNDSIWLGLAGGGVIQYDGYQWKQFDQTQGLLESRVKALLAGRDGTIYARTPGSLSAHKNGQWTVILKKTHRELNAKLIEAADGSIWSLEEKGVLQIKSEFVDKHILSEFSFDDIHIDADENLWLVAHRTGDLHVLPIQDGMPQLDKRKVISPFIDNASVFNVYRIIRHKDCLWLASSGVNITLRCYNMMSGQWQETDLEKFGGTHRSYGILSGKDGSLWVWGKYSINRLNNGQWTTYHSPHLASNRRYELIEAPNGSLWFGGMDMNLKRIKINNNQWGKGYEGLHFQCETPAGTRWFLERNGMIVFHHLATDSWRAFTPKETGISRPTKVFAARDGTIWLAGTENGSAAVARLQGNSWQRDLHASLSRRLSDAAVLETNDGRVLFGALDFIANNRMTSQQHGGLVEYKKDADQQYTYRLIKPPFAPMHIFAMTELPNHRLLLANRNTIYSLTNSRLLGHEHVQEIPGIPHEFTTKANTYHYIIAGKENDIWVSRARKGIFRFDGSNWLRYTVAEGLSSNVISHLLKLADGSVLAVTSEGINRFDGQVWHNFLDHVDLEHTKIDNISLVDDGGFWINYTVPNWHIESRKNMPDPTTDIKTRYYRSDRYPPDTRIEAFNQSIAHDGYNYIYWAGADAWSNLGANALQYSYRLNNMPWSPFINEQRMLFDKLPSGNYYLEVRSRDADFNIDPTPARIHFQVIPPIWQQHWFQVSVMLALGAIVILIVAIFHIRVKHLREIDEMKLSFFTYISHELRTPLSLILGPVEKMLSKTDADTENLSLIQRNTRRLMNLVNQLLDFRKLHTRMMQVNKTQGNIVAFVKTVADSLDPLAEQKGIDYIINLPNESYSARFDADILEKILTNLIDNAIKYTAKQGSITVELSLLASTKKAIDTAKLTVEDDGLGITKHQIKKIFDPFYRAYSTESPVDGFGIGLTLVKQLVELCGGQMNAQSPIHLEKDGVSGYGTCFTVLLPLENISAPKSLDNSATANDTITTGTDKIQNLQAQAAQETVLTQTQQTADQKTGQADRQSILFVEDDTDLQRFIENELKQDYFVILESNGLDGLESARRFTPDLIVTDIMMPMIDGTEFCRRLNLDSTTRDIPVIVLTALSSEKSELEALELGADDYIAKPFSMAILKARIDKIFSTAQKFRDQYSDDIVAQFGNGEPKKADNEFLQRAIDVIEDHIAIADYDVIQFAEDMGIKHKTLYIKIKTLTNLSLKTFIRTVRLKHALKLLRTSKTSVTEVSKRVGFHDVSYFSRCFKTQFGISPTDVERPE